MKAKKTWNQHVVKKENKALVLDKIKQNSPISRADIATSTGLNKGTVSSLVNELLDEKLISESGPGKSSGGRRPVMLLFNQLAGRSEEHTSELQSRGHLVCRLLLEKKNQE